MIPGVLEIKRLTDDFGVPSAEYGHYPYEMKYFVEEEVNKRFHFGDFSMSMDKKPKIEEYQLFPISDHLAQSDKNQFRMKELIYLTNILSEHHFFQYNHQQNWFVELEGFKESKWGQSMFSPNRELGEWTTKSSEINEAKKTALQLTNVASNEHTNITFTDIVNLYLGSDKTEIKNHVYNAIRTFSKSQELRSVDFNASYLFFYSVLESLAEEEHKSIENKKCEECGQIVYSVSKKLKSLLDKYCYEIPNKEKNKLYDFRSKIVHKGRMLPFTQDHQWVMETQEDLDAFYYSSLSREYFDWLKNITQITVRNYIYQNLKSA